jgi:Rad3-related DNA helicase
VNHPQHRGLPVQANFTGRFSPRKAQEDMMSFVEKNGSSIVEAPTGSGKTAVEEAALKAAESKGISPCFLIAPNKTIVQHLCNEIPDAKVALGRHDYVCLHPAYTQRVPLPMADEIPCLSLDCPSRVNQETGQTQEKGALPCP